MKPLKTADELAEQYGVKGSTIKRWARDGKIPSIRPSTKTLRFDEEAVLTAMQGLVTGQDKDTSPLESVESEGPR